MGGGGRGRAVIDASPLSSTAARLEIRIWLSRGPRCPPPGMGILRGPSSSESHRTRPSPGTGGGACSATLRLLGAVESSRFLPMSRLQARGDPYCSPESVLGPGRRTMSYSRPPENTPAQRSSSGRTRGTTDSCDHVGYAHKRGDESGRIVRGPGGSPGSPGWAFCGDPNSRRVP